MPRFLACVCVANDGSTTAELGEQAQQKLAEFLEYPVPPWEWVPDQEDIEQWANEFNVEQSDLNEIGRQLGETQPHLKPIRVEEDVLILTSTDNPKEKIDSIRSRPIRIESGDREMLLHWANGLGVRGWVTLDGEWISPESLDVEQFSEDEEELQLWDNKLRELLTALSNAETFIFWCHC